MTLLKRSDHLKPSLSFFFIGHGDRFLNIAGHPYFIARSALRKSFSQVVHSQANNSVLDVGCGSMPYKDLFHPDCTYIGLEINQERNQGHSFATHLYDGKVIPFPDRSFDIVFLSQVLEHVPNPQSLLHEINRVLKPKGTLVLSIPFLWPEHEQPWDFQRYTSFGIRSLLEGAGLKILSIQKLNPGFAALLQLHVESIESFIIPFISGVSSPAIRRAIHLAWRICTIPLYLSFNLLAFSYRAFHRAPQSSSLQSPSLFLDLVVAACKL